MKNSRNVTSQLFSSARQRLQRLLAILERLAIHTLLGTPVSRLPHPWSSPSVLFLKTLTWGP